MLAKREKFQLEQGDKWENARQQWRGFRLLVPRLLTASLTVGWKPRHCWFLYLPKRLVV
ncbi:MAG TPA: hypothetical protein VKZ57_10200 [Sphingobacterium sp.]|nr:hypothetical protein [Sphingobacterium sp.]